MDRGGTSRMALESLKEEMGAFASSAKASSPRNSTTPHDVTSPLMPKNEARALRRSKERARVSDGSRAILVR